MNRFFILILLVGYSFCSTLTKSDIKTNYLKTIIQDDVKPLQYFPKAQNQNLDRESQGTPYKQNIQRIFGGIEVSAELSSEFQVGLDIFLEYGQKAFCGGAIISRRYILTSANCLDLTVNLTVIMGAKNRVDPSEPTRRIQVVTSDNFIIHPEWDRLTAKNNIGLIRLPRRAPLINAAIGPIPIADTTIGSLDDLLAFTIGWGYFNTSNILSPVLRFATSPIIPNTVCQEWYGKLVDSTNLCTDGSQGQTACVGDIGGPLLIADIGGTAVLAGIVSFGSLDGCDKLHPTVFTRILSYREWIQTNANV